jgi:hypothetical protein
LSEYILAPFCINWFLLLIAAFNCLSIFSVDLFAIFLFCLFFLNAYMIPAKPAALAVAIATVAYGFSFINV